jgi:hypothetical protein
VFGKLARLKSGNRLGLARQEELIGFIGKILPLSHFQNYFFQLALFMLWTWLSAMKHRAKESFINVR